MPQNLTPRELTEKLMSLLNTGDETIADEIISEDYNEVDKNVVPGATKSDGVEGVKEQIRVMRLAFPDGHWRVEEYIELPGDGRIATRDRWTGTHKGEFMGVKATGRSIDVTAMACAQLYLVSGGISTNDPRFSVMRDGKIIKSEMMFDKLAMLQQLGCTVATSTEAQK